MKRTKGKKAKTEEPPEDGAAARTLEGTTRDGCETADAKSRETDVGVPKAAEPADPLAALTAKVAKLEDSLLRAKADYQNLLRRSSAERSEAIRYANTELMRSLLGVLDDFERSLAAAKSSDNLTAVVDGVRLVYDNLCKALRDHGLEPIDALYKPFDPNVHEALLQRPSVDHPSGTVIEQIARGYSLGDRVVRPAKVIVGKAPDVDAGETTKDADKKPDGEASVEG